jgi:hypothetical protein
MNRRLRSLRYSWLGLALLAGLLNGCVYRQLVIDTPPEQRGAIVQVNGKTVGATPVDVPFDYYGDYQITILRDGYQTLTVKQPVPAPWYEYFPLDFVSEHLIPFSIRDIRRLPYTLQPLQEVPPEYLKQQAEQFRAKGQTIGVPSNIVGAYSPTVHDPQTGEPLPPPRTLTP